MRVSLKLVLLVLFLIIGIADASILTIEHFQYLRTSAFILPCSVNSVIDCGKVLTSSYATLFGVPLSLFGLLYYLAIGGLLVMTLLHRKKITYLCLFGLSAIGVLFSLYLFFIQAVLIGKFCLYCLVSTFTSISLYVIIRLIWHRWYQRVFVWRTKILYRYVIRPVLFLLPSDFIHEVLIRVGEWMGSFSLVKKFMNYWFHIYSPKLGRTVAGIHFPSPVGLSAGFDYEARLTQILPSLGFGFMTVGTITAEPYEGNPPPMLGRLVKSKSLLVNKGFKNPGAEAIVKKLTGKHFVIPVGISIGMTNKQYNTVDEAIENILTCFRLFEKSQVKHSYYELNISCPNLKSSVDFTNFNELKKLLGSLETLHIKKPIFVKMPINISDADARRLLHEIVDHSLAGVIFGNLQKDRKHPSLNGHEVIKVGRGYFSGKPTWFRSNELISLTRKEFDKKLVIIGCGGIFTPLNALEKMKRGASLVQLITGMVFEGPQLVADINSAIESAK